MPLVRRHLLLCLPVLLVEIATFLNTTTYYGYHEQYALSAILLSAAFSALMTGSVVLVARPSLTAFVRTLLFAGVAALFVTQAIANVSGAYLTGSERLPAAELTPLWGEGWLIHSSAIFGGVINLTGLLYWLALGKHLESELRHRDDLALEVERYVQGRRTR